MGDQVGKGGILSPWLSRRRTAAALPYLSGRVLDFGCGAGNLASFIEPARYLGVDCDEESLRAARSVHSEHAFTSAIPAGESFDTIAALAVIEHTTEPATLLNKLAAALTETGSIVLTTPHPSAAWLHALGAHAGLFSREAHEQHAQVLGRDAIYVLATSGGLRVVRYQRFQMGFNQLVVLGKRDLSTAK